MALPSTIYRLNLQRSDIERGTAGEGFPNGKLGEMLQTVYEIKVNGLEYLFEPLRSNIMKQASANSAMQPETA